MYSKGSTLYYYVFMALAIFGWGLSTPFIEFGLEYISPYSFLFFRFFLASLVATPYILIKKREQLKELFKSRLVWIIGLAEAAGLLFQYIGQEQGVPSGLAALLSLIFLLFVPFLSPLLLEEKIHPLHLLAIVLGAFGVSLIATEGQFSDIAMLDASMIGGVILLVLAAFSYALYIVFTSRLTTIEKPDVDTYTLFYLVLVIVTIVSLPFAMISERLEVPQNPNLWLWLILLILFSTLLAFICYFEALKGISANSASVLLLLQILIPFFIDLVFQGRRYPLVVVAGVLFVVLAMIVVVIIPFLKKD